jgi:AcrR family transcriptional regulator
MPRTGLSSQDVVAAAAELADEAGFARLTMGLLAQRLGIRTPSLYKHVADLADLRHQVAALAARELGEETRDALQGKSGRDALAALFSTFGRYVTAHPGRYAATVGARADGPDDPLLTASNRFIDSISAALRGYGIAEADLVHAIRTIRSAVHGFALLQQADGFQWNTSPEDTFAWMTEFFDRGLRASRPAVPDQSELRDQAASSGLGSAKPPDRQTSGPSDRRARDRRVRDRPDPESAGLTADPGPS